jgi:hypothetical protein
MLVLYLIITGVNIVANFNYFDFFGHAFSLLQKKSKPDLITHPQLPASLQSFGSILRAYSGRSPRG